MPELAAHATPRPLTWGAWPNIVQRHPGGHPRLVFPLVILLSALLAASQARAASFIDASMASKLEAQYGTLAKKRGRAVNRLVDRLRFADIATQLYEVNGFFNRFDYRSDRELWDQSDYWASPLEFIGRGAGDCEDFAIAKYFALRALGVPDRDLAIAYVRDTRRRSWHMVLLYQAPGDADALVLDSRNPSIAQLERRRDLLPVYDFNAATVSVRSRKGRKSLPRPVTSAGHREWKRLLAAANRESPVPSHHLARLDARGGLVKTGFRHP